MSAGAEAQHERLGLKPQYEVAPEASDTAPVPFRSSGRAVTDAQGSCLVSLVLSQSSIRARWRTG